LGGAVGNFVVGIPAPGFWVASADCAGLPVLFDVPGLADRTADFGIVSTFGGASGVPGTGA